MFGVLQFSVRIKHKIQKAISGSVRLDPRLYKKLSKLADRHDLVIRDLINYVLEKAEPKFATYAKQLDKIISKEESVEYKVCEECGN